MFTENFIISMVTATVIWVARRGCGSVAVCEVDKGVVHGNEDGCLNLFLENEFAGQDEAECDLLGSCGHECLLNPISSNDKVF